LKQFVIRESSTTELDLDDEQALQLQVIGEQLAKNTPKELLDPDDEAEEDVRQIVTCTRTLEGKTRVCVAGAVGAIQLAGAFIEVRPKIDLQHFVHLARHHFEIPRSSSLTAHLNKNPTFWEVVAYWAVDETSKALRAGIVSDYVERSDELGYVRGRVRLEPTLRNLHVGKPLIVSEFEELDHNHALNRVLRAAMKLVAVSPRLSDGEIQRQAHQVATQLADVDPLVRSDLRVVTDRRTKRFAMALDLCKRILSLNGINLRQGTTNGRTFLIPTAALAEGAIRKIIAKSLGRTELGRSPKPLLVPGDKYFTVNPDLYYPDHVTTGDVKYKVAEEDWNRSDIAQALMFSNAYETPKAFIATFGDVKDRLSDASIHFPDRTVRRILWQFGPDQAPEAEEVSFTRRITEFLDEGIAVKAAS
jgi:5-methylcytosine-specific restriction endonuclease McrBC regulatory subunit McrC